MPKRYASDAYRAAQELYLTGMPQADIVGEMKRRGFVGFSRPTLSRWIVAGNWEKTKDVALAAHFAAAGDEMRALFYQCKEKLADAIEKLGWSPAVTKSFVDMVKAYEVLFRKSAAGSGTIPEPKELSNENRQAMAEKLKQAVWDLYGLGAVEE